MQATAELKTSLSEAVVRQRLEAALKKLGYADKGKLWERTSPWAMLLALNPTTKTARITPKLTQEEGSLTLVLDLKVRHQTDWYTKLDLEYFHDELSDILAYVEKLEWPPFDRAAQASQAGRGHLLWSLLLSAPPFALYAYLMFGYRMDFVTATIVFILAYTLLYLQMPFLPLKARRYPLRPIP